MYETKPSLDYKVKVTHTKYIDGAGLPYTVYVSFDLPSYDNHSIKKCIKDFRKLLADHCGPDIGIYFDKYSLMATLSFRNEDEAAMFTLLI